MINPYSGRKWIRLPDEINPFVPTFNDFSKKNCKMKKATRK